MHLLLSSMVERFLAVEADIYSVLDWSEGFPEIFACSEGALLGICGSDILIWFGECFETWLGAGVSPFPGLLLDLLFRQTLFVGLAVGIVSSIPGLCDLVRGACCTRDRIVPRVRLIEKIQ